MITVFYNYISLRQSLLWCLASIASDARLCCERRSFPLNKLKTDLTFTIKFDPLCKVEMYCVCVCRESRMIMVVAPLIDMMSITRRDDKYHHIGVAMSSYYY